MVIHPGYRPGTAGMRRSPFSIGLAIMFLLFLVPLVSAGSSDTTADPAGGSIFFDTSPPGATIWVAGEKIGISPFTYYTERNGTLDVLVEMKYYEDYTGLVTVSPGQRVVFTAVLVPLPSDLAKKETPSTVVVTTAAVIEKRSTVVVPTPWPETTTPESPLDPAVCIGAIAAGLGILVIQRR